MFTQRIANLMPRQPIYVTLRYVQMVPKTDEKYELVIPMIVGPRYEGNDGQVADVVPVRNAAMIIERGAKAFGRQVA